MNELTRPPNPTRPATGNYEFIAKGLRLYYVNNTYYSVCLYVTSRVTGYHIPYYYTCLKNPKLTDFL